MSAQQDPAATPQDDTPENQPLSTPTDDASGAAPLDAAAVLLAQVESLQAELAAAREQVLRAAAEAENVRRRSQEDVAKARKFGTESFAENLVPVRDSLEAALAQPEQSVDAWREGAESTLRQLVSAFERNHMHAIDPAAGDKFDPNLHQAISAVPSEQPANTIVQVLQKGYLIHERVLRPALVMVAA